jgi:two-component system OmpR family response regulator
MAGHRILVVEDDAGTRGLLSDLLQSEGYGVSTAGNGAEAIRRLVELKPCVILLDFEMPVMDGHDFHEVQKRLAPDVPVICLTGAANAPQMGRLVGATAVHTKPVNFEVLAANIADLCATPHAHQHAAAVEASIQSEQRNGSTQSRSHS